MRILLKSLKWVLISLLIVIVGLFVFVQLNWKKTYDAPLSEISASTDSAIIAKVLTWLMERRIAHPATFP